MSVEYSRGNGCRGVTMSDAGPPGPPGMNGSYSQWQRCMSNLSFLQSLTTAIDVHTGALPERVRTFSFWAQEYFRTMFPPI
jgi:ferric iron reductase protein FhuF